jgi:hypothetical protein
MKRALAFACVLLLGVGFASFAQFSGTWETTVDFYPAALTFAEFADFDSDLDVTYAVSDWEFTMESSFDPTGLTAMDFAVEGILGAFTLTAEVGFIPMFVTEYTVVYDDPQTASACYGVGWVYDSVTVTKVTKPLFDDLAIESEVSIAGVTFGGRFMLFGEQLTSANYGYTYFDGIPAPLGDGAIVAGVDPLVKTFSAGNGSGWKFWGSGSVGGMDVTAQAWFNLEDPFGSLYGFYQTYVMASPPLSYMFLDSGYYSLVCEDCIGRFTGLDILLEGFSFACTDVSIFTSFDCCGWNGVYFLLEDIGLGCCWDISFDMLINFTVDSKSVTFQPDLTIANACFTIVAELDYTGGDEDGFSIDGINILGVGLSYTWNGITFTSMTSLDIAKNPILGGYSKSGLIYSPDYVAVWSPVIYTEAEWEIDDGVCTLITDPAPTWAVDENGEGFYELKTFSCEMAEVWEYFEIAVDGDGCCGGGFDLEVAFYFGDIKTLSDLDGTYRLDLNGDGDYSDTNEELVVYGDGDTNDGGGSYPDGYISKWSEGCDCCPCDDPCSQELAEVEWDATYTGTESGARLFDWVKTTIEGSIGMSSNFDLTFGLDVSTWGWEELSVGFEFTF